MNRKYGRSARAAQKVPAGQTDPFKHFVPLGPYCPPPSYDSHAQARKSVPVLPEKSAEQKREQFWKAMTSKSASVS